MSKISDTILGAIKVLKLPDRTCFTNWSDFINSLGDILAVEVPVGYSGVIVSDSQPEEQFRESLWVRRDNAGSFVGLYAFSDGKWRPVYLCPKIEIVWIYGDSSNPPDQFKTILPGDTNFPSAFIDFLVGQYYPAVGGGYSYFATYYVGA